MPCKPEQAEREVPLFGPDRPAVLLRMSGCEVRSSTFAVAVAGLPTPVGGAVAPSAEAALRLWAQATWASLRQVVPPGQDAPPGWTVRPAVVPGAEQAQRWSGPAVDHRGQPLRAEVLWAAGRGRLVQAAWYGEALEAEVADTFFGGVRLP